MAQVTRLEHPAAALFAGAYTLRESAVLLRATTPPSDVNVRQWQRRRDRFIEATTNHVSQWIRRGLGWDEPVRVSSRDRVVTFADLVRLRMIALLRSRGIAFKDILAAEEYVRRLRGLPQPFITEQMWTAGTDVFVDFADALIAASRQGQLAFGEFMAAFLTPASHGLTFTTDGTPALWQPWPTVLIDPEIQFGAPCIAGTRVETRSLWSLNQAGDSVDLLAEAFHLRREHVRDAIEWEQRLFEAAHANAVLSR